MPTALPTPTPHTSREITSPGNFVLIIGIVLMGFWAHQAPAQLIWTSSLDEGNVSQNKGVSSLAELLADSPAALSKADQLRLAWEGMNPLNAFVDVLGRALPFDYQTIGLDSGSKIDLTLAGSRFEQLTFISIYHSGKVTTLKVKP